MRMVRSLSRALAGVLACALLVPAAGHAGVANRGLRGASRANPLAGVRWGGFHHPSRNPSIDAPSAYYNMGVDRRQMRRIIRTPRFRWFGSWIPQRTHGSTPGIYKSTRLYIRQVTHGNPRIGVQIATFRLTPWENRLRTHIPSRGERGAYRRWIHSMARAIGNRTRMAMVVEPDGPLALEAKGGSSWPFPLLRSTIRTFNALHHTTVYMDAGSGDWMPARAEARLLAREGIRHARGFSLNLTHFDSTRNEIRYARKVERALARIGLRNKHAIISTAMNGHPWAFTQNRGAFRAGPVCTRHAARQCVVFGRRPTTRPQLRGIDGLMWIGRPWINNRTRRSAGEIADLVRYSPFR